MNKIQVFENERELRINNYFTLWLILCVSASFDNSLAEIIFIGLFGEYPSTITDDHFLIISCCSFMLRLFLT